jgi:predicted metal-dependent hydrolase
MPDPVLHYLSGYPEQVLRRVRETLESGALRQRLAEEYPKPPEVTTHRLLHDYVMALKNEHLRRSDPLSKIAFDDRISTLQRALGLHSFVSRVQGAKLKAKHELLVASVLATTPPEFLRMVVVHELAHLKEKEHNKAFYQLCCHMEPNYEKYEVDLRLHLTERLWRDQKSREPGEAG